jgi:hypothetical protein
MELLRRLAAIGAVATTAVILVTTFTPIALDGGGCLLGVPCTVGHALVFGALGFALAGLYVTSRFARRNPRRALVMILLGVWILAAGTELVQEQIGRAASLADWVADMVGAIAGLLGGGFVLRRFAGPRLASSAPPPALPVVSALPSKASPEPKVAGATRVERRQARRAGRR